MVAHLPAGDEPCCPRWVLEAAPRGLLQPVPSAASRGERAQCRSSASSSSRPPPPRAEGTSSDDARAEPIEKAVLRFLGVDNASRGGDGESHAAPDEAGSGA